MPIPMANLTARTACPPVESTDLCKWNGVVAASVQVGNLKEPHQPFATVKLDFSFSYSDI